MDLPRLRSLTLPARVLATGFLLAMGAGFVAAQVNNYLQHAGLDGQPGLSVDDVEAAFHGRPGSTLLTSKIAEGGSMAPYIPRPSDREVLDTWVRDGASPDAFEPSSAVLDRLCVRCHHPGGQMFHVPFAHSRSEGPAYDLVEPTTAPDTGMSYLSLARSSHAHLFGMGVLYAIAGAVFLLTEARPRTKVAAVALPFAAMFVDIGCWWLTKLHTVFALGVVAGGMALGVAFAILIVWPLWELWTPGRARGAP